MAKAFYTTYSTAVHWLHNNIIMCNNIAELDSTIWENARFELENENGDFIDIYQFFITDCSEWDVEFLEKHFGLLFTYSELLDKYILCVDHLGTSWDYVACEVLTHTDDLLGDYPHCKSYDELTKVN